MQLGKKVVPPAPYEGPEWKPHPNGRPHFWIHRDGRTKYTPPTPAIPQAPTVVVQAKFDVQETDDDLFWIYGP
jgi:hypothetical protein